MTDGTNIYSGFNNPASQGSRFAGPNATVRGAARTPIGGLGPAPSALGASGAPAGHGGSLPSPLTWLFVALAFLVLLKVLGEHPKTALDPRHIHLGGYDVFVIWLIVLLTVPLSKIAVNGANGRPRPAFDSGPLSGFAALVNAT